MKKKKRNWFSFFHAFIGIIIFSLALSCSKNKIEVVTLNEVSDITQTKATCAGVISTKAKTPITARGICWSTDTNPMITVNNNYTTNGTGVGSFIGELTGLSHNTTYYARAYASYDNVIIYGNIISFKTEQVETSNITDIDGNKYKTVKIGTQWWMAENLRTSKYRNGKSIPNITERMTWSHLRDGWGNPGLGAYCNFSNDTDYSSTYGSLYNWDAVNTGDLCPAGWHVPNDAEWLTLIDYVGGEKIAGKMLKEKGTTYWKDSHYSEAHAIDGIDFSAIGGFYRKYNGDFIGIGYQSDWWSSTEKDKHNAWYFSMYHDKGGITKYDCSKKNGFFVRCVAD